MAAPLGPMPESLQRGAIIKRTGYNDQAQIDDDILLPKLPFCAHMKFWEGYNTDSASESFDRRLDKSESDHEDEGEEVCEGEGLPAASKTVGKTGRNENFSRR